MLDLGRCLKHAVSKYDAFKWSRAASFGPRGERRGNIDTAPGGSPPLAVWDRGGEVQPLILELNVSLIRCHP